MRVLAWILAVFYLANGGVMILMPTWWYDATPGVAGTGPFNPHFVVDVGIAFGVSGLMLAWNALGAGWRLAFAGATFPLGHALFHVAERLSGGGHGPFAVDLVGIHLPVLACLYVAWAGRHQEA